jgi:hypothetical protein
MDSRSNVMGMNLRFSVHVIQISWHPIKEANEFTHQGHEAENSF